MIVPALNSIQCLDHEITFGDMRPLLCRTLNLVCIWVVFSGIQFSELFLGFVLFKLPYYRLLRFLFVAYLILAEEKLHFTYTNVFRKLRVQLAGGSAPAKK